MSESNPPATYPSGIPKVLGHDAVNAPSVMVITGMSGAGRTKASSVLDDLSWYVVDNLPPHMLGELVSTLSDGEHSKMAAVVDVRGGGFFADLLAVVDELEERGVDVELMFLEASDAELVQRFEQVRRPHPLQGDGTLLEGIGRERQLLAAVRDRAEHVIDTTQLSVHDLAERVLEVIGANTDAALKVNVQSFGYKNGLPTDAEFVIDVRFVDNPHWDPELRPLTGLDPRVREKVLGADGVEQFIEGYLDVLEIAFARFAPHDRRTVSVAVGCTGGKHRSVAIAEELGARLAARGFQVRVSHRDRPES